MIGDTATLSDRWSVKPGLNGTGGSSAPIISPACTCALVFGPKGPVSEALRANCFSPSILGSIVCGFLALRFSNGPFFNIFSSRLPFRVKRVRPGYLSKVTERYAHLDCHKLVASTVHCSGVESVKLQYSLQAGPEF